MQSITGIKSHIKSVKDIGQITNAMKLISISKLRKSNEQYFNNVRYFSKIREVMKSILDNKGNITHPYLQARGKQRTAFIVIASDSGMAGEYNHRVLNFALQKIAQIKDERQVYVIGKTAASFFEENNINFNAKFIDCVQNPNINDAVTISKYLLDKYRNDEIDEINIIFTHHRENRLNKSVMLRLFPIFSKDFSDVYSEDFKYRLDFEPSADEVFDILVPQYILGLIYSCIIQSVKCENEERMEAMNSATNNAKEMLDSLSLEYHRARQEQITTELTEISSEAFRDGKL